MRINLTLTFMALVIFTGTTHAYDASRITKEMNFLAKELYNDKKVLDSDSQTDPSLAQKNLKSKRKKLLSDLKKEQTEKAIKDIKNEDLLDLEQRYFSDEISTKASGIKKNEVNTNESKRVFKNGLNHRELYK